MAKDLLLEIGMEEVPSRFIRSAAQQLAERLGKWLDDSRIDHSDIRTFATPRRIAVLVGSVAEKQQDRSEEVKGPSQKIALDANGGWSKAALGFARSQGVDPSELYFKEVGGVEYVHAVKSSIGTETSGVLGEGLAQLIQAMSFPKNMRWGSYELRYARPIRWIVALYGDRVIDLEVAGVRAGRTSRGHRFLGGEAELADPAGYVEALKKQFAYVDIEERRTMILDQINRLALEKGWTIPIKDELLEEVLFLVEYPTVLFGTFNPEFLSIPQEVLITSMREHQRYFPVLDANGALLPYFVTVRNGNRESLDTVARGNEKVLRARLSDARFFYEEDQKASIESFLVRLETVVFHEELGTVADKVRRIGQIAAALSAKLGLDDKETAVVARSSAICKFDLVTQMVYEFPELQGVMGEDYARKAGEPEAVAKAVFEHYQPRFSGDSAPASRAGAIVSIADKIDTIAGCFAIGIAPTGSQDPYALRRQSAGIVQIILEHELPVKLSDLFDIALQVLQNDKKLKREAGEIRMTLYDFFALRIKNTLTERNTRYDAADAVMAAGIDDIRSVIRRAEALSAQVQDPAFKSAVESFNRVSNLAAKAESDAVRPEAFTEAEEAALFAAWQEAHGRSAELITHAREEQALQVLRGLEGPITRFFDAVMVMAEDESVRANRLGLLSRISADFKRFADFSKLVQ